MNAILPLAAFLALASTAFAQKTPDEALKTFTVADGLQLELFASEPMFVNPTCIDVDHKGRVWVCESVNYRCDLRKIPRNRKEGDRLVVLEDTDGDGKADKVHTFYQEKDFIAPLGVAVAPNPDGKGQKVYVCHSPHIYLFDDADGDLKADGPPKIVLTGFKGYDHDHGVHGIHFGPDGKLYFSVGDSGVQGLKSSNGDIKPTRDQQSRERERAERVWTTNRTDCQAATVWRCNPDGSGLELLAHNFRNPYEPAVDSFGTVFISDNDDDGNQQTRLCYVMPGGNYGYWPRGKGESHWHEEQPGIVHKVLRTGFGSPTGLCWYEGTLLKNALPPQAGRRVFEPAGSGAAKTEPRTDPRTLEDSRAGVYGLLLHTDAGPREVRCFVVKPKGAGYECDKLNLVTSSDNWFRPSDVCVAPDGSVFVSDWYDPGVGGHGMGDTTRGRIYRLTAKGHKGYKVPAVELSNSRAALDALASPNLAHRQAAFQSIIASKPDEKWLNVATSLNTYAQLADGFLPWFYARLFWITAYKQPVTNELIDRLDHYADQAARLALVGSEPKTGQAWFAFYAPYKLQMVRIAKDGAPNFGAVLKLPYDRPKREAPGGIKGLGEPEGPKDRDLVDHFTWQGTVSINRELLLALRDAEPSIAKDYIWKLAKRYDGQDPFYLAAINIAVGTDPKRRKIILADFEKHFPEWNDRVAKLVWELRPPQVIAKLDQKLADPKLTAEQKAFVLDILASGDAEAGKSLLRLLASDPPAEMRRQAVKNLVNFLPTRWAALRASPELRATTVKLRHGGEHEKLIEAIQLVAAAELAEEFDLLYHIGQSDLLPVEVARAAVIGLGSFKREGSIGALRWVLEHKPMLRKDALASLARLQTPEALKVLERLVKDSQAADAVEALAGTRPGSIWLLDAHAKRELPVALVPDASRLLRNSPHQDLRNRALIAFPAPGKLDPKKLPAIATLVKRRGDGEHGREVFRTNKEAGCIRCHSVRGVGGNIGPDLSMIGKKGSRENLFESLIEPDKAVADQFIQHAVETKAGLAILGLLVEETPEHVVLRDAQGKDHKIAKSDIEQRAKSPKSIMPGDLVSFLSEDDLVDVVAYLESLKTPALTPESWHLLGPFDNGQGDAGLDKAFIPEPRVGLKATHDGKDGKVSWRTMRLGADGYYDLLAFHKAAAKNTVSYLYREIESPADQEATILLGTDDGCKLWVNGDLLLEHRRHEAATPERDTVKVKLKKGTNAVLLKINNGDGPHGFFFTVVSEQELKPEERK